MNILFVASECTPFVKIGGLADVVGSLPQALKRLKDVDVRVILPKYKAIPEKFKNKMVTLCEFTVELGEKKAVYVGIQSLKWGSVRYYFVDNLFSFGARDNVYNHGDESERFAFFQKAVLETIPRLTDFPVDLVHCHDWHAGMVPLLMKTKYPELSHIPTILTIHNLAYQGIFSINDYRYFNMTFDNRFEFEGYLNFLKAGIVSADWVTTVSETYSKEILTDYFGYGMQRLLRQRIQTLSGIMNGINVKEYDPGTDLLLAQTYRFDDVKEGKKANKRMLLSRLEAPFDPDVPLVGIISRLVGQKGFDLIKAVIEEILSTEQVSLVLLGDGEKEYVDFFRDLASRHPDQVRAVIGFDNKLAHLIYAGADLFLMPSKFEPCGLGQLIALRYGTLPLVRETGGLVDSVRPYNEFTREGNGFSFTHYNAHDMMHVIRYALKTYRTDPESWNLLVRNAMDTDFSWARSAKLYKKLYRTLMRRK
ncbi:MAG TPA: glycogen synthase [Candidatus Izemoplasmatales bacterium]|nr:glycogen synthase [Candidatus Izemoplasmatales bacterium]